MITAVAFCPQAPVLVPELAQGAAPELEDLRAAARAAIRRAVPAGVTPVVIGSGTVWRRFESASRGTLAGYGLRGEIPLGTDVPGPVELPEALTVGAWLTRDALGPESGAIAWSVGPDAGRLPGFDDHRYGLVVLGDGSARRSEKAPGYLDDRAAGFDAAVAATLAAGKPAGLAGEELASRSGEQLLVSGLRPWAAVSGLLDQYAWDAELLYEAAPYGVGYFVAVWTRRG